MESKKSMPQNEREFKLEEEKIQRNPEDSENSLANLERLKEIEKTQLNVSKI